MIHFQFFVLTLNLAAAAGLFISLMISGKEGKSEFYSAARLFFSWHLLVILLSFLQSYLRIMTGKYNPKLALYIGTALNTLILVYPLYHHFIAGRKAGAGLILGLCFLSGANLFFYFYGVRILSSAVFLAVVLYTALFGLLLSREGEIDGRVSIILKRTGIYLLVSIPFLAVDFLNTAEIGDGLFSLDLIYFYPFVFTGIGIILLSGFRPVRTGSGSEDLLLMEQFDLSRREKEIAGLILKGSGNREIAEGLYISLSTVKKHVNSIYRKTGTNSRIGLLNRLNLSESGKPSKKGLPL